MSVALPTKFGQNLKHLLMSVQCILKSSSGLAEIMQGKPVATLQS